MTSKLKCPFCQTELEDAGIHSAEFYFWCTNCYMKQKEKNDNYTASPRIWQALIQAKQDLEIARKALEEMQHWLGVVRCSIISHLNNQNNTLLKHYETDPTVQNIDKAKSILKQYLEQIEHKESE